MLKLPGNVPRSLRIAAEYHGSANRPVQAVRDTTVDFFRFRVLLAKPMFQSIFHTVDVRGTLGQQTALFIQHQAESIIVKNLEALGFRETHGRDHFGEENFAVDAEFGAKPQIT